MTMPANGLGKLIEECGELLQIAGKKLAYYHTDAHPDGKGSMRERLQDEIGDVRAAISLVTETMNLDADAIAKRAKRKLDLFRQWHADDSNAMDAIGWTPNESSGTPHE